MLVLDANIAAKFVVNELGRAEALTRLRSEPILVGPDWIRVELAHTLWKQREASGLDDQVVKQNLATVSSFFHHFIPSSELVPMALDLAFEMNHWVYDCLYLACALESGSKLLTADRKFANAAVRAGYSDVVELLTWKGQPE